MESWITKCRDGTADVLCLLNKKTIERRHSLLSKLFFTLIISRVKPKTRTSLFLGRFWTKIQSDNFFETLSTPGLRLEVFPPLSVTFVLNFTDLPSPRELAGYFQVNLLK